ncbi:MAG: PTS sugar transporter subunit IIA [Planctomycetota bacterium]|jgi:PTS system nitrogen regulatory IIA component|nr:PTS sugar transporter subunit IIA [Planctomycetota bacterium]
MHLMDFIRPEAVLPNLEADTARGAVEEMVAALVKTKVIPASERRRAVDAVMRREKKGTTGFGNGVAIPHAKQDGIDKIVGAVGRSAAGIDFAALDGQPVHLFFLLLSGADKPEEHLKAMEHIFRSIKNDNLRRFMCQATTREELLEVLREADEELP